MKLNSVRINEISIAGYKGIDKLSIAFPVGRMLSDPDINVLGSKNGVGKTSVLECCSWALLAASSGQEFFDEADIEFPDIVKSGFEKAEICAVVDVNGKSYKVTVDFLPTGKVVTSGVIKPFVGKVGSVSRRTASGVLGLYPDPVSGKSFFFLHSYRKVQEGRPELGMLLDPDDASPLYPRRMSMRMSDGLTSFSMFKRLIVRHMMERAQLFEASTLKHDEKNSAALEVLDGLLKEYASVKVGKLRPYRNNTIDVQVERLDAPGKCFSIDGLSSGQKEVIATLFLIWSMTYKNPRVVLIDEPELHLNIQWHSGFVNKLIDLAPNNQYILATHAEAIMASVPAWNRHLLVPDQSSQESPL